MLKKIAALVMCALLTLSLSSCSNATNLSDMSVAQGVSVDYDGAMTRVCVQYLDLAKGTATADGVDSNITSVAGGEGDNVSLAVSKASAGLTGPVFFGQNKIIVFGTAFAESGLDGISNYALRSIDSRPDVLVALCDGSGEEVIHSKQENAKVPAQSVYDMIKTGERVGLSVCVSVNDLLNMYNDPTSDVYLPCLGVKDDKAVCGGIMIFSGEKPAALLDDRESFGFLLMNNLIKGGTLNVYDEKLGSVGFEIKSAKIKKSASYSGSQINFDSELKLKLILNNTQKGIAVKTDKADISRLEALAADEVEALCASCIKKCFASRSDVFSLGRMLAKSDSASYNALKNNWHDMLSGAEYKLNARCSIELISDSSLKE